MSQQGNKLEVGATIPAGTIVLLTSGEYSDFGVCGIFKAETDTIVPGRKSRYSHYRIEIPDIHKLSTMLTEIDYVEVWTEN